MDETGEGNLSDVPSRADLVVVGAGVAGLIAARCAAQAGAGVVVLDDPERPAASQVAAGMVAPVGEASWGEQQLLAAGLAAAGKWPDFAERLSGESGRSVPYRRCGSLHVALDADEAVALERVRELHERLGLAVEARLGSECRQLEPGLATSVRAGLEIGGEAEVDPRALLAALRSAVTEAGVKLIGVPVRTIDPLRASVELRAAGAPTIAAETVVVAAGAWSGAAGLVGEQQAIPVRPVGGEILRLRTEPGQPIATRIIRGERFYLVPRAGGEVVIGATVSERGFDRRVRAGAVHELLREAYRALPELAELELVEMAAGLRPGSPDNAPIIGPIPGTRVIAAGGLYRNGILLAPLLAEGLAALLSGSPVPAELAPFSPSRFSAARRSGREDATLPA